MTLKVLIVDDEALARARLRTLLGDCAAPKVSVEGDAANATQALEYLLRHQVDVVLLDIHMPGADGLTLARTLRTMAHPPAVVFVTAHAEHAVHAFELEAIDYLTKPVRLERLQIALQKVERTIEHSRGLEPDLPEDVLIIQERNRTDRVPVSQVLFLKAELKYITVRTSAHSYMFIGSLTELEEKYKTLFIRVHRNALVARRAMRALEKHVDPEEGAGWAVRLDGVDELLFVSRRQMAAVREVIGA
jgi:two-component system response regulator AlgR